MLQPDPGAIATVKQGREEIGKDATSMNTAVLNATTVWSGPAAATYAGLYERPVATRRCDSIAERMQSTVDNYHGTETTNYYTIGGNGWASSPTRAHRRSGRRRPGRTGRLEQPEKTADQA